jgi:hypothetical protein
MILFVSERANGDISILSFPDTAYHRRNSLGRRWFVLPHEVSSWSHERLPRRSSPEQRGVAFRYELVRMSFLFKCKYAVAFLFPKHVGFEPQKFIS